VAPQRPITYLGGQASLPVHAVAVRRDFDRLGSLSSREASKKGRGDPKTWGTSLRATAQRRRGVPACVFPLPATRSVITCILTRAEELNWGQSPIYCHFSKSHSYCSGIADCPQFPIHVAPRRHIREAWWTSRGLSARPCGLRFPACRRPCPAGCISASKHSLFRCQPHTCPSQNRRRGR